MSDQATILLWGLREDPPMAAVWNALERMKCRKIFIDQRAPLDTAIDLTVGESVDGVLRVKGENVDLAEVKSFYLRPFDAREIPNIARAGERSELWRRAVEQQDALLTWAEITPALVLNRGSHMASNSSKPYQCASIASFGFRVPETLITTDAQAALEFRVQHREVIYKSISSVRSIVSRMTDAHLHRLNNIVSCPTQFQRYIPGTDYRVHVVGEKVFSCMVTSDADDYRYAEEPVGMHPCELPAEIAERCVRMATSMNLMLSGIDLRCTPHGDWYCYEVNPSPAFTVFEARTGQPITQAVAELLVVTPSSYGIFGDAMNFARV